MAQAAKKSPQRTANKGQRPPDVGRDARTGQFRPFGNTRFDAVMKAARSSGLLGEKSTKIGGRISPALLEQAKKQTGIEKDTDLIEFALANIALEDDFAKVFRNARGTVDPALKLGF
jgi:hypothetical protein